jgi:UDP-N-acetylmuramoylalanine--D-glutamate ligase
MGLGRFGGGAGVTRWLVEQGAEVLLTDIETEDKLAAPLAQIADLLGHGGVEMRLGGHNVGDFTTCDLVVANPAVPKPWENRFLRAAWAGGIPVVTEIELLAARLPDRRRVIGVTGSAGKSTTSAMIHHVLVRAGRDALLGGNIGGTLLPRLSEIRDKTWVVLELSSAMLCWLGGLARVSPHDLGAIRPGGAGWSPGAAVVTNFSPNHLDWHGDVDHYRRSKQQILSAQQAGDVAVLVPQSESSEWAVRNGVHKVVARGEVAGLAIPGRHNRVNAQAALEAVFAVERGIAREIATEAVQTFAGLPHRLQLVATLSLAGGRVRCFDDSKSTTPESCLLAVGAFEEEGECGSDRVHLIAGGYDKGSDLAPIGRLGVRLAGLYTVGKTGPAIARAAAGRARECGTVEAAVRAATRSCREGDVILLSPACASWDQFENYEKRGEQFVALVKAAGGSA